MVFHWSLSDSKSPQVSRTLLSILAVLNNAVIWMVSTRPSTLVTVPKEPITIGIIVTFMFHCFFNCLARSRYLSFFSHVFRFILWSVGTTKPTILQILFLLLIIISSGLLAEIRWSVSISKSHLFVWSNSNFLRISQWITLLTQSHLVFSSFCVNLLHSLIYYHLVIRVFHISVSWWSFTGVWETASLLKSPGLFSVFWSFSIM